MNFYESFHRKNENSFPVDCVKKKSNFARCVGVTRIENNNEKSRIV